MDNTWIFSTGIKIEIFKYLHVFVSISDPLYLKELEETIRSLEQKGIWIAIIPCKLILDLKQIASAANLTIRDFMQNQQKAKKINIQFLLRFLGESQIKDAFKKIEQIKDNNFCLVAFFNTVLHHENATKMLKEYLIKMSHISMVSQDKCQPDIESIIHVYNVNEKEIESVSRHNAPFKENLVKILLERIALSFLR